MKCIGVCLSHQSTLNALDKLGENYNRVVKAWQENIQKQLLTEVCDMYYDSVMKCTYIYYMCSKDILVHKIFRCVVTYQQY